MLVAGILKGYLSSNAIAMGPDADCDWRRMYMAAAPVALVMFLGMVGPRRRRCIGSH